MRQWLLLTCLLAGCSADRTTTPSSEIVSFASGKDTVSAVLVRPAGRGRSYPAVVLVHGDFGRTEHELGAARRLARKGYVVLVVDLHRGEKVMDIMDAHILDRALPEERVRDDLQSGVQYLSERLDVRRDAIGILGWDAGGGYALDAALAEPRLKAVVTCYGRLRTEAESLKALNASVLAILAGRDEGIGPDVREAFRAAMKKAGKKLAGLHVCAQCGHGFMNPPPGTKQDEAALAATEDAWRRIEAFLADELK